MLELGVLLSIYFPMNNKEKNDVTKLIKDNSEKLMQNINFSLKLISYNIERTSAFFRVSGVFISKANYTDIYQIENNPGKSAIQSFFWTPKVFANETTLFESFYQENIMSNFTIFKFGLDGPEPVQGNDVYWPIVYAAPALSFGNTFVGYDLNSTVSGNGIVDIGLSSVNTTGTFQIILNNGPDDNPYNYGFLLQKPSLINVTANNTDHIFGLATVSVRVGNLIDNAISNSLLEIDRDDLDIFVFDKTHDGFANNKTANLTLLYKEDRHRYKNIWYEDAIDDDDYGKVNQKFTFLNRKWNIHFWYNDKYLKNEKSNVSIIVVCSLAGAFVFIDIIIIIIYVLLGSYRRQARTQGEKEAANHILGYVNHEIRNPLNIIKSLTTLNLEEIQELNDNENNIKNLNLDAIVSDMYTVISSCDLLEHIVNDILTIRKLESGKLDLDNNTILIADFVIDIQKTIKPKFEENPKIEFLTQIDPTIPILYFDKFRMSQILLNFLTNALKFTEEGTITFSIEKQNHNIVFSVADTGIGIEGSKKKILFKPFSQANVTDSTRHGGTGLGLHLCKLLAERMGAEVGFDSVYGQGSNFWIKFPNNSVIPLEENINDLV